MPAVRPNEVGDISVNGIVCTFGENRCNVLNSLAGTVATNIILAKSGALAPYVLLICAPNIVPRAVQVGCVTIQANPYRGVTIK
jgi:hypothetical protein